MRNFWGLLLIMILSVFMLSGCGGNVYSGSSSDGTTTSEDQTPSIDSPDSSQTENILNGTWLMIEGAEGITLDYTSDSEDISIELSQISGTTIFSNAQINGETGTSFVTSHTSWRAFREGDTRLYLGIVPINIDDQVMTLTYAGSNKWHGEISDAYHTVMEIEILSERTLTIQQKGVAFIDSVHGVDYDITFTFRKQ